MSQNKSIYLPYQLALPKIKFYAEVIGEGHGVKKQILTSHHFFRSPAYLLAKGFESAASTGCPTIDVTP